MYKLQQFTTKFFMALLYDLRVFTCLCRTTVKDGALSHPFAITVYAESLYWTDWKNKSIFACSKTNCSKISKVQGNLYAPMDIDVFEADRQGMCPRGRSSQLTDYAHLHWKRLHNGCTNQNVKLRAIQFKISFVVRFYCRFSKTWNAYYKQNY